MPNFAWDEKKNILNLRKHGIAFDEAMVIFDGPVLSRLDTRFDYGEVRSVTIGAIDATLVVVVVHTDRNGVIG